MTDHVWILRHSKKLGFYTTRAGSVRRQIFEEMMLSKTTVWFPTLRECLEEGYGTVADITVADSKNDFCVLKLSNNLRKRYKFAKPWNTNDHEDCLEARGIRIFAGIRRSEMDKEIHPKKMFSGLAGRKYAIRFKCKEDRNHVPAPGDEPNPKDTVFKYDIFLEGKLDRIRIKNVNIDPIIRNDGGGTGGN